MSRSLIHQLTFCAAFITAPVWAAGKERLPSHGNEAQASAREPRSSAARPKRVAKQNVLRPNAPSVLQRHNVARGETLSHIAVRYDTSVSKIVAQNQLDPSKPLRSGQVLLLPADSNLPPKSWHPYAKRSKKPGHIEVFTPSARFEGLALEADGRLRPNAVRALNQLLGAGGAHPPLPERLVRLLIQVSETFGGRSIRLVSGYRTRSYFQDSRHKASCAVDFSVSGVPNAILRDYLREFDDVGVGFYPNSSFVHLDVRDHSAYWVDYAGPGEAPRSTPFVPRTPPGRRPPPRAADRRLLAELDGLLDHVGGELKRTTGRDARASQRQ